MSVSNPTYKIGLVAETHAQLLALQKRVNAPGLKVVYSHTVAKLNADYLPHVDAWVARFSLHNDDNERLYELLEETGSPVIFDEQSEAQSASDEISEHQRRLAKKVIECVGRHQLDEKDVSADGPDSQLVPAETVWVLAASTGGPEAVNEFLKSLNGMPAGVAFLYVQHIDSSMHDSLEIMLKKHRFLNISRTVKSKKISSGCLYIINPDEQIEVSQSGELIPAGVAWQGLFKPCIDQVIAKVARCFGPNSGAIVFSGMGEDGAKSCQYMKGLGGTVYVQHADSCAIDSMPVSAQTRCDVDFVGTPSEMGRHFFESHAQTLSAM